MLCYIYCSLATADAETMRSVKQEERRQHLNYHKDAVLRSRVIPSSFLQGSLARLVSTIPFSAFLKLRNSLCFWMNQPFEWISLISMTHSLAVTCCYRLVVFISHFDNFFFDNFYINASFIHSSFIQNENIGIIHLPACRSNPIKAVFVFRTQFKIF